MVSPRLSLPERAVVRLLWTILATVLFVVMASLFLGVILAMAWILYGVAFLSLCIWELANDA